MGYWKVESKDEISCILYLKPFSSFGHFIEYSVKGKKKAFIRLWRRHFRRYAGSMSFNLLFVGFVCNDFQ